MPSWKKVITSGSNAELNQLTASAFNLNGTGTAQLEVEGSITASNDISSSGVGTFASLDISGDIDVDGTTNLDAVDIDGTVQIDGNTTFGVDGTGVDARFYGDTTNKRMLWDQSEDQLKFYDNTEIAIGTGVSEAAHDAKIVFDGSDLIIQTRVMNGASNSDIIISPQISKAVVVSGSGDTKLSVEGNITASGNISGSSTSTLSIGGTATIGGTISATNGNIISSKANGLISGSSTSTGSYGHLMVGGGNFTSASLAAGGGGGSGTITALNNQAANRLVSIGSTTTELDGEANLTYDGTTFTVNDQMQVSSGDLIVDGHITASQDLRLGYKPDAGSYISASSDGTMEISGSGATAILNVEGSITSSNDISASGYISASKFVGDGSELTGLSSAAISSYTNANDNRVITSVDANTVNGEANLTFDGSTLTVTGTLISTTNKFSKTSDTDNEHQGDVVYFGGTTSMDAGKVYHYKSDGTWELANADDPSTSDGLLGVALGAASDTNGMLLRGMVTLDHDPGAVGDVLYVQSDNAGTPGEVTATKPAASGDCVRVIGYCLDASNGQIWFSPDNTFVEVA